MYKQFWAIVFLLLTSGSHSYAKDLSKEEFSNLFVGKSACGRYERGRGHDLIYYFKPDGIISSMTKDGTEQHGKWSASGSYICIDFEEEVCSVMSKEAGRYIFYWEKDNGSYIPTFSYNSPGDGRLYVKTKEEFNRRWAALKRKIALQMGPQVWISTRGVAWRSVTY